MAVEIERARRLFTVDEYARMVEVGILTKHDRVELIHGEIIEKMPIGRGHFGAVTALMTLLVERLARRAIAGTSGSLRVPPRSMPEPDLLVLAQRTDFYREADLQPEHVLLLVEVADLEGEGRTLSVGEMIDWYADAAAEPAAWLLSKYEDISA